MTETKIRIIIAAFFVATLACCITATALVIGQL
jgi:hypothetical protein